MRTATTATTGMRQPAANTTAPVADQGALRGAIGLTILSLAGFGFL